MPTKGSTRSRKSGLMASARRGWRIWRSAGRRRGRGRGVRVPRVPPRFAGSGYGQPVRCRSLMATAFPPAASASAVNSGSSFADAFTTYSVTPCSLHSRAICAHASCVCGCGGASVISTDRAANRFSHRHALFDTASTSRFVNRLGFVLAASGLDVGQRRRHKLGQAIGQPHRAGDEHVALIAVERHPDTRVARHQRCMRRIRFTSRLR